MSKRAIREAARQRALDARHAAEDGRMRLASEQAQAEAQETAAFVFLTSAGAFLSLGKVRQLIPGLIHKTMEGTTYGGPPMSAVMGGFSCCSWADLESWADASGLPSVCGRFESVRIHNLGELDPEVRDALHLADGYRPATVLSQGIVLRALFESAREQAAGINTREWQAEAARSRQYACGWARGAVSIADTLPIEVGVDWSGPNVVYIRGLKQEPQAVGEWRAGQYRQIGRELTAALRKIEGRSDGSDVELLQAVRDVAAKCLAAKAPEPEPATAGAEDGASGAPAPARGPAPALMPEITGPDDDADDDDVA